MIHILDAGPMVAVLRGEPGKLVAAQILIDNPGQCFAHFFNLTEVYHIFFRQGGKDADPDFLKAAATFKGSHARSLPDVFCRALVQRLSGTAVTTDHAEFDPLVSLVYCPNLLIR